MHTMLDCPVNEIAEEMKLTKRMVRYYLVRGFAVCREVRGCGAELIISNNQVG